MDRSEKVEHYYAEDHHFAKAVGRLRDLVLKTELEETYKWMFPTYTLEGKNVLSICKFKKHFGIWFFNGVSLKDKKQILENAQEGKTQDMRHWKFYSIHDIDETGVLAYMYEAIENQKNDRVFAPLKKNKVMKISAPKLLKEALNNNTKALIAFQNLSLCKQNKYSEYIASAKQEKTKHSRLAKILPIITKGNGLNDMYR